MVKGEQAGAVVGVAGTVISCSAMMFSLFPALLGVAAASASTGMMSMSSNTSRLPAWVTTTTHYSAVILAISIVFMLWAVRRSSRSAKVVIGIGIALLIANEISMTPYLFLPALALVVFGNLMAWRGSGRFSRASQPAAR